MKKINHIKIGTTGTYPPFSFLNLNKFEGFALDLVFEFAKANQFTTEIIPTSWETLENDLENKCFVIAADGIALTQQRSAKFLVSHPLVKNGKVVLTHKDNRRRFSDLASIDQSDVRVIANPGGTNEAFVRKYIHQAEIVMCSEIEDIFLQIRQKKVDIFITDLIEAKFRSKRDEKLCVPDHAKLLSHDDIGFLISKQVPELASRLNQWLSNQTVVQSFLKKWDLLGL